jgi:hypothetical protein
MSALLFALLLAQAEPPPLSEEQTARLRALVHDTQTRAAALTTQLETKERELARIYFEFALDERRVAAVEAEIVELQRQKLANYHQMQVELRTIVDRQRFDVLKQRLRQAGFFGRPAKDSDK